MKGRVISDPYGIERVKFKGGTVIFATSMNNKDNTSTRIELNGTIQNLFSKVTGPGCHTSRIPLCRRER
jgi:hypothetical protein